MTDAQALTPGPPNYEDPVMLSEKTAEYQHKVNKAVAGQLNTPGAREIVEAELQVLPQTLQSIEKTFISIGTALLAIDARELVKGPRGGLHRFHPIWKGFFTRYTDVLRKSQESATTVKFHIDTLLQVAVKIKDPNIPLRQKQSALVEYREYLTKFMESENEVDKELRALSKEITEFKNNLRSRLGDTRTNASLEVTNLQLQIKRLCERLDEEDSKGAIPRAFDAVTFTFRSENLERLSKEVSVCAGLSGLRDLFPPLMRMIEAAILTLNDLVRNYCERKSFARRELDCEKKRLEQELDKARAKLHEISRAVQEVHDMDKKFTKLARKIAILTQINRMLVMDTKMLELSLKRMSETETPVLMETFLDVLEPTYKIFHEALTAYILAAPATVKASPAVA